ncbi:YcxB family protein [Sphingomonas sp. RS6]
MQTVIFKPTLEDVLAATRLNYRSNLRSQRVVLAYIVPTLILAAAGWFLASPWSLGPAPIVATLAAGYWLLVFTGILGVSYLRLPKIVRRTFAQQRSLHDPITIAWSEHAIAFTSERGSTNLAWEDYVNIVKGKDSIVLRQTELLFNFVPTRLLTPEQIEAFPEKR